MMKKCEMISNEIFNGHFKFKLSESSRKRGVFRFPSLNPSKIPHHLNFHFFLCSVSLVFNLKHH